LSSPHAARNLCELEPSGAQSKVLVAWYYCSTRLSDTSRSVSPALDFFFLLQLRLLSVTVF